MGNGHRGKRDRRLASGEFGWFAVSLSRNDTVEIRSRSHSTRFEWFEGGAGTAGPPYHRRALGPRRPQRLRPFKANFGSMGGLRDFLSENTPERQLSKPVLHGRLAFMPTLTFYSPGHVSVSAIAVPPVHIFVAYDDQKAYGRARRMLTKAFAGECHAAEVWPVSWRFDELELEPWRQQALAEAVRADILIVSTSSDGALPIPVTEWLQDCFATRRNLSTTVVSLGDSDEAERQPESFCRRFLRDAAAGAGLDFVGRAGVETATVG